MTEHPCYRCEYVCEPPKGSAFEWWCSHDLLKPAIKWCEFFVSVAGTDFKERE